MESTNGHVQRWWAEAVDAGVSRAFETHLLGKRIEIDPAKALFLLIHRLWCDLETHKLHPGFDIRSYMSMMLGTVIPVSDEIVYPVTEK